MSCGADTVIVGGGMAYTFLKAQGLEIGNSLLEEDKIDYAKDILSKGGDKIVLPIDSLISDSFDFTARKTGKLREVSTKQISGRYLFIATSVDRSVQ